ncbi:MAG: bifunctional riboflavin kinase/FAD synthetase [bacterium]|nr:bifunctional riboflavin kinase/FAD synthetase [bacterium]
MRIVRYGNSSDDVFEKNAFNLFDKNTVLTVGTYDGVHRGHQGILKKMRELADENGSRVVVMTFDPHPQIVLKRDGREPVRLLTTIDERCNMFEELGVDVAVVITFTREFASTSAEQFVRDVAGKIGVQQFFVGHDHMFGKDRGGNEELLQRLSTELGFEVHTVEPLSCNSVVVSSSKIRAALSTGNVAEANEMLGRPYALVGSVVKGDGRGKTLGFPTANIVPLDENQLVPANGVYVVTSVIDGRVEKGLANIGRRPTFTDDTEATIEVHFLDYDEDLYDDVLTIRFHTRVRDEKKFENKKALIAQINSDKEQATELIL